MGDVRHRAVRHHAEGIFEAEREFGVVLKVGRKEIPIREILENHVNEDLGFIPTRKDWLSQMEIQPWMNGALLKQKGSLDDVFGGKSD